MLTGGINDRRKVLEVVQDDAVEQHLIAVLQCTTPNIDGVFSYTQ